MVLAKPKSITPYISFEAQVYVLKKDEGGRSKSFFKGYRPQFYVRTTDVTGQIAAFMNDAREIPRMIRPGDRMKMIIDLIQPIAIERNMKFAIREGGKTVGVGVVGRIIE